MLPESAKHVSIFFAKLKMFQNSQFLNHFSIYLNKLSTNLDRRNLKLLVFSPSTTLQNLKPPLLILAKLH
jgi:hypothetical protein